MNAKRARALRKEAGFHPTDEREMNVVKKVISKDKTKIHRIENKSGSSRDTYRALKKAERA